MNKREFCEKRLKDSHEFRKNLCYENRNFRMDVNEILPKFCAVFVRGGQNSAQEMSASAFSSAEDRTELLSNFCSSFPLLVS